MIKFKVGDKVQVQPGHPDIGVESGWGWWYEDFLSGEIGTVIEAGRTSIVVRMERNFGEGVESETFSENDEKLLKHIAVVRVPEKATVEDAENLLAMLEQLEDSEAEIKAYEADLVEMRNNAHDLKEKIKELKEKLNIA